ncbi:MAG: hypothetical protein IT425_02555 [Pirellulales bacterium]|nr:hypothetical protein [Pirellulales bacterium]
MAICMFQFKATFASRTVFLVLLEIILIAPLEGRCEEIASISEIEKQCLDYRRSIRSGQLRIEASMALFDGPNGRQPPTHSEIDATFDADRMRFDVLQSPSSAAQKESLRQRAIILPDTAIVQNSNAPANGLRYGVGLYKTRMDKQKKIETFTRAFDPRGLGLFPGTLRDINAFDFASLVGNARRQRTTERNSEIDGKPARIVEYIRDDGFTVSMWFTNSNPRMLARTQLSGVVDGKLLVDRIDSTFTEGNDVSSVVFPRQLLYQRLVDGDVVQREEINIVKSSFNEAIPPEVFTIATMHLEPGTYVHTIPSSQGVTQTWDGKRLLPLASVCPADIKEKSGGGLRLYFIVANLVMCLMLFIIVYVRRFKKAERAEPLA